MQTRSESETTRRDTDVPRVFVIDDERNFARRLALAFRDAGFESEAFYGGADALEAMQNNLPDLLVLDVRMPGMDGLQCLRTLHANADNDARPPVILLTGHVTPRVEIARAIYPGSCILSKPCSYDSVIDLATRLLRY